MICPNPKRRKKSKQNLAQNHKSLQDSPIKVEPKSPPKMDDYQLSTYTISNDVLLSSHSCDLLNTSMVSSSPDDANEYEEFPPSQLFEKGDAFSSLAQGHDEYCEAPFVAPPSEEGAANDQVFEDMPNPFTGANKPKKAPCRPNVEPSVCYMCDEVIPRIGDTIALQLVSCDACRATYHLRCAKLTRVPRHGSWIVKAAP